MFIGTYMQLDPRSLNTWESRYRRIVGPPLILDPRGPSILRMNGPTPGWMDPLRLDYSSYPSHQDASGMASQWSRNQLCIGGAKMYNNWEIWTKTRSYKTEYTHKKLQWVS